MKKHRAWLGIFFFLMFCLPSFCMGKTLVNNRPPLVLMDPASNNGEFVISVFDGTAWREVGHLLFNQFLAEKRLDLSAYLPTEETARIKIVQQGGGAAHVDSILLGELPPTAIEGSTDTTTLNKVSRKDHDLIDTFGKIMELRFSLNGKTKTLSLAARVEAKEISKTPFQFPRENLYKEMTERSGFYGYRMTSGRENLAEEAKVDMTSKPFFKEFSRTGSGHPSGFTYGWVENDQENLYVTIDFTPDNTMDGDKDYAKVYVKTDTGLREFKTSMSEFRWGRPQFRYTDKVPYEHKVYEFKIPLKEMGSGPLPHEMKLQLAFAAYGTASPGDYQPAAAYDPQNNRYIVVYEKVPQGSYNYDVYGQLINLDGTPSGSAFLISDAASDQRETSIARGSDGKFLVVWKDYRDGYPPHIYGQLVNPDGSLYNSNFLISNANVSKSNPAVANSSTSGRYLVAWEDSRGDGDIYGQLVNEDGTLYGAAPDVNFVITNAAQGQYHPSVAYDSTNDRFLTVWYDYRSDNEYDVYGQIVDVEGTLYGSASNDNFVISNATGNQYYPVATFDEVNERFLVVWEDYRDGGMDADVYGQLVNADGTLYGPDPDVNLVISDLTHNELAPSLARDGCNAGFWVAWMDIRSGNTFEIYGQRVNEDGSLNGGDFAIDATGDSDNHPSLVSNDNCGALVAFGTQDIGGYVIGLSILGGLPDISLSTYSHDFGDVDVGSSATQEITISNVGAANLQVNSVILTGGDTGMFGYTSGGANPCPDFPTTILPDSNCTLNVIFTPTAGGTRSANLIINSNDFDEPSDAIQLTGTGISPYTKITLLAPNGGELFTTGENTLIEWGAPDKAEKFKLFYSVDNGLTWKAITKDFITGMSYGWTAPALTANKKTCLVKVVGYKANNVSVGSDRSDGVFTIEVIKLTYPDGGEPFSSGGTETLTWTVNATKNPVASIKLYYTKNNGLTWTLITSLAGDETSYEWTSVPTVTTPKTKCKVKVVLRDASGASLGTDSSDDYFTITNDR